MAELAPDRSGLAGVLCIYTLVMGFGIAVGNRVQRWKGQILAHRLHRSAGLECAYYLVGGKSKCGRWIICQFRQPCTAIYSFYAFQKCKATPEQKSCLGHAGHILDGAGVPASEMGVHLAMADSWKCICWGAYLGAMV